MYKGERVVRVDVYFPFKSHGGGMGDGRKGDSSEVGGNPRGVLKLICPLFGFIWKIPIIYRARRSPL